MTPPVQAIGVARAAGGLKNSVPGVWLAPPGRGRGWDLRPTLLTQVKVPSLS